MGTFAVRICIFLIGTAVVATTAFSASTTTATGKNLATTSSSNSTLTTAKEEGGGVVTTKSKMGLFSSCLGVRRHDEPSFWAKQLRRFTVFRVAFQVFVQYKLAGRRATKLKKKLGLDVTNDASDDHPEVRALWSAVHQKSATHLLVKIQQLEGFWVKVGQYLSSRGDVMPMEYLETLSTLQDAMPPRSWDDTYATLKEELSPEILARLESIDQTPLSTASLAQVHRAVLLEDNSKRQDVVLKVQHRGVASLMIQDMQNLRVILQWLAYTDSDLDFEPVVREYNQEVRKELDFRKEAQNMKDVSALLKEANITAIIPETQVATERVLIMDFCEGFPVRDTQQLDEYKVDRELLLERICAAWAVQMHVGGVFQADPHMGNLLVSTAASNPDASVPVLLDFGLTKRFDDPLKLAFARLMHASYETDVDGLLLAFEEMGLKLNRHDPFQDMANMQRGFGDTVPQSQAREASQQRSKDYQRRQEAQKAEAGLSKKQKLRNPVDAWPSELVFFGRVTAMLRGMCSRLEVSYPYLRTMALAAQETLRASVPVAEHASDFLHPSASTIDTPLQQRLIQALQQLKEDGHVVGLQICVLKEGQELAQIAAGTLGTANPRPVTPNTLFNVFSVSKGVLTIGALHLWQEGLIESLDDPVSKYWPAFASKPTTTVRHLLTHQAGLANEYPEDATIDTLLDWSLMTDFVAKDAKPVHEPGTETQYHALSYAWLVGGLVEAVTGKPYEDYLDKILPYNKSEFPGEETTRRDLFLAGICDSVDNHKDLAVLSVDRTGIVPPKKKTDETINGDNNKRTSSSAATSPSTDDEEEDDDKRRKQAKKVLAKYQGLAQLMNPSVFNMRKVREAKLPSANGHASASSLAEVFDAVIRSSHRNGVLEEPILSKEILEKARTPSRTTQPNNNKNVSKQQAMLDDAQAMFGLGFQLHEFTLPNGEKGISIGHAGLGGSVVMALPEEETVVAFTCNHLSGDSVARKRLLGIIFDELGWQAPPSIPVEVVANQKETAVVAPN